MSDAGRAHQASARASPRAFRHLSEDMQTALACLRERDAHDLLGDAGDLDVHLQRRDTFRCSGNLEVHVADGLVAENVREHRERVVLLMRPIAMPATGRFSGMPASIMASDDPQTVAIDDEPLLSVISETTRIV